MGARTGTSYDDGPFSTASGSVTPITLQRGFGGRQVASGLHFGGFRLLQILHRDGVMLVQILRPGIAFLGQ